MRAPHSVYSLVSSSFESLRLLGGSARERVLRGRLRAHSKSGALAKRDAGRGNCTARKMACLVHNQLLCVSNILTNHCHLVVWQGGGGDPGQYIECLIAVHYRYVQCLLIEQDWYVGERRRERHRERLRALVDHVRETQTKDGRLWSARGRTTSSRSGCRAKDSCPRASPLAADPTVLALSPFP